MDTIRCGNYILYGKSIDGKKEGHWISREVYSGIIFFEGNYSNGKKTGDWKIYSYSAPVFNFPHHIEIVPYENNILSGLYRKVYVSDTNTIRVNGKLINGERSGEWLYYAADGKTIVRKDIYKKGKRISAEYNHYPIDDYYTDWSGHADSSGFTGTWAQYFKDKTVGGGEYRNNKRTGKWTFVTDSYLSCSGEYLDGKKEGRWTEKAMTGGYSSACHYHNDLKTGVDSIFSFGQLSRVMTYVNGEADGAVISYQYNNQIEYSGWLQPNSTYQKWKSETSPPKIVIPSFWCIELMEQGVYEPSLINPNETEQLQKNSLNSCIQLLKIFCAGMQTKTPLSINPTRSLLAGHWIYYYESGKIMHEGDYYPMEMKTIAWDSTNQVEDPNNPGTFILAPIPYETVTQPKIGWWKYYNLNGELIREERYEMGVLKETIRK